MRLFNLEKLLLICILLGLSTPSLAINYSVTNTNDSGTGSLREAILLANASSSNDTITFTVNGTINLDTTLTVNKPNSTLTITGNGAASTILNGQNSVQVLNVNSGTTLTLEGVTITHGRASNGGGIFNAGTLTVNYSTLSSNFATTSGGGIYTTGALTVNHSTLSGNSATTNGGGILKYSNTLVVSHSTFSNNSANDGGGIFNYTYSITLPSVTTLQQLMAVAFTILEY